MHEEVIDSIQRMSGMKDVGVDPEEEEGGAELTKAKPSEPPAIYEPVVEPMFTPEPDPVEEMVETEPASEFPPPEDSPAPEQ